MMTTFRVYKILKVSKLAEQKLASRSAPFSMELIETVVKLHALLNKQSG
jgi:hypothetical protein